MWNVREGPIEARTPTAQWGSLGFNSRQPPNNQHTEPKPQTQIAGFHFASSLQLSLLGVYVYAYIYIMCIYIYRYIDI